VEERHVDALDAQACDVQLQRIQRTAGRRCAHCAIRAPERARDPVRSVQQRRELVEAERPGAVLATRASRRERVAEPRLAERRGWERHESAMGMALDRARHADTHVAALLQASGPRQERVDDPGVHPGRLVVVLRGVGVLKRVDAGHVRETHGRHLFGLPVPCVCVGRDRLVHGKGCGSSFRSAGSSTARASPASKAAV